jgi:hypothetical protein
MDSFDVTDMSNALKEVTDDKINKNAEASNLAREKGWVPPEQYDYAKYNTAPAARSLSAVPFPSPQPLSPNPYLRTLHA